MKKAMLFSGIALIAMNLCAQTADTKQSASRNVTDVAQNETPGALYKFDLVVQELQNAKVINSRDYSWTAEVRQGKSKFDEVRIGDRVPIATAVLDKGQQETFQYIDVGTTINYTASMQGEQVAMELTINLSSVAEGSQTIGTNSTRQPIIRQTKVSARSIFKLNQPTTIFSLDDPGTTGRYEGKLTISKVKE